MNATTKKAILEALEAQKVEAWRRYLALGETPAARGARGQFEAFETAIRIVKNNAR
jgi:hypothetical protein